MSHLQILLDGSEQIDMKWHTQCDTKWHMVCWMCWIIKKSKDTQCQRGQVTSKNDSTRTKAWCQIKDTYWDNVCLMCPSTGQERFQFSRGASVSVLVETTRNDFAAVSSVTKRWLHSIWWPCLHFLNGRITTSYFAIYHNTKSLAVYLLRTRGSYWSRGPNLVPVNKRFDYDDRRLHQW